MLDPNFEAPEVEEVKARVYLGDLIVSGEFFMADYACRHLCRADVLVSFLVHPTLGLVWPRIPLII